MLSSCQQFDPVGIFLDADADSDTTVDGASAPFWLPPSSQVLNLTDNFEHYVDWKIKTKYHRRCGCI